ncbi:hypothetical protein FNV43_RR20143 [Rhamnella rubrinervis]|uniref:Uncharacterized protein n=1 Tax=Rhamnella rubrinervis TaxID=2594499 RepID=A0A8K0DUA4_9ROSA|nr:hypothetical protein FNV43_RR20143 [Rhamnella rubrinervis]
MYVYQFRMYMLTQEGQEAAYECLMRSGLFNTSENTAISVGPSDLNLVNIDSAEEETMSPVDLRRTKSTDILTARLGIMLIISLSELMSDVQGTQMKFDGTLEESGEAQRYRKFLGEMANESERKSANLFREGGLLESALSAIPLFLLAYGIATPFGSIH